MPRLPLLHGLRLRLLAAFGLVIAISLLFAGVASLLLLRDQQADAAEQRIGRLVTPLSRYVFDMELAGWRWPRMRDELAPYARYFDVRILVLDGAQRVVVDTDDAQAMRGETLNVVQRSTTLEMSEEMQPFRTVRASPLGSDMYLFTTSQPLPMVPEGTPRPQPEATLVIAVPATDVTSAWAQLLPRFAIAGGLAALFAVVVGTVLSARITRPIAAMTRASEAMAGGDYQQRIDATGGDEVATLARAFNQMASQVGRSSRAMRQLLGNVSHELKTPLTSIQGFSQALLEGVAEDEAERKRLAQVIHDEAENMRRLVDDLLYLSRIESGELTLALDDVDLDALVAAGVRRFASQADAAEVSIRQQLDGGRLTADGRRLEQVLANLIDNAVRFAQVGSEVRVRSSGDSESVTLEVHNEGDPIPEADLPYVFDRFYQADPARSDASHSGLGLAIVGELVHAHGGRVSVQSTRTDGTTFVVRLPRGGPADTAPDEETSHAVPEA